jgi:transglutaminase-like putative cysteine protease
MPTDGIVKKTAMEVTKGAQTDVDKVRRLYDWMVANTYREPKVRGCGTGDIKAMLETGNMGGKCGDINALFVGLCRAAGVPARDVYGIRLVPSAFGYRELSGNPANLARAALPGRGVPGPVRLGGDGSGRRGQGHAPGDARVGQDDQPSGGDAR